MTQPPNPSDQKDEKLESLTETIQHVRENDDPGPQPADAVTDCGVAPGHNRLEDREGA